MSIEEEQNSEDLYADIDFDEEDKDDIELKDAKFIAETPKTVKKKENKEEKLSQFFNDEDKLIGEKIIQKKSGEIIEIKYDPLGHKEGVLYKNKDKFLKKAVDYYANGSIKMVTEYEKNGGYKSLMYNADGSRQSFVEKHPDGTADAVYYDADAKGTTMYMKLDKNKNLIEKRFER